MVSRRSPVSLVSEMCGLWLGSDAVRPGTPSASSGIVTNRDQFILKGALLFELWTHRP